MAKVKVGPVTQLLIKARAKLVPFKNHTRGELARGPDGLKRLPNDPEAVCWCALGALYWASDTGDLTPTNDAQRKCYDKLAAVSRDMMKSEARSPQSNSITVINDSSGHAAVLQMYNRAIILAKGA